jgi:secondary thiamine-phosphate synthase enzyme
LIVIPKMNWFKETLDISTQGKGLYPFTRAVSERIRQWRIREGMCHLFVPHTSASLAINESYDPSARADLEESLERLIPENQPWFRHTLEGPDDSTSHIRAMLTGSSLAIPIDDGQLSLGTWQGLYLFEHRAARHHRKVLLRCLAVALLD